MLARAQHVQLRVGSYAIWLADAYFWSCAACAVAQVPSQGGWRMQIPARVADLYSAHAQYVQLCNYSTWVWVKRKPLDRRL